MMEYLGYSEEGLKNINGYHTAREIVRQPGLWKDIYDEIVSRKNELLEFFQGIEGISDYNIILTGAGSSAYIGEVLESAFIKNVSRYSRAVATTTIVTHPEIYFTNDRPTLVISFARSGNSPESVAAITLANEMCKDIHHFVITCNPTGRMLDELDLSRDYFYLLPEGANDVGLAMTGSFTGMLLAGYLVTRLGQLENLKPRVERLAQYGDRILEQHVVFENISKLDFDRVIFIGSGPLQGIAREAHLKVQELTNGRVMCNYDSYLGLRHGPKVVIGAKTLVVFLLSGNDYVFQYEKDLVGDMVKESLGLHKLGIGETAGADLNMDTAITFSSGRAELDPYLFSLVAVLPAQIIGFYKSLNSGYKPDSPSENGAISRVVKGVKLYEFRNPINSDRELKIN